MIQYTNPHTLLAQYRGVENFGGFYRLLGTHRFCLYSMLSRLCSEDNSNIEPGALDIDSEAFRWTSAHHRQYMHFFLFPTCWKRKFDFMAYHPCGVHTSHPSVYSPLTISNTSESVMFRWGYLLVNYIPFIGYFFVFCASLRRRCLFS